MAHSNRGKTYYKPSPKRSAQHKRVKWELIAFLTLTALLGVLRLYLKLAFPETYLSIAEHSALICEVAAFIIPGD